MVSCKWIIGWEEVSSLSAAPRCASFATHLCGPVPARNAGPKNKQPPRQRHFLRLRAKAGQPDLLRSSAPGAGKAMEKSVVQLQVFASSGLRRALAGPLFPTPLPLPPSLAWARAKACLWRTATAKTIQTGRQPP